MLSGKTVAITNVSQYMGPATAKLFLEEQATLFLFDPNIVQAKKVLQDYGVDEDSVHWYEMGDSSSDSITKAVDWLVDKEQKIDVLVNVNAYPPSRSPIAETTDEAWREMHHYLVDELFYWTRAALTHMIPRQAGKIINFTSAAGVAGMPNYSTYATARAAANGFTKSVGKEVARHNIQVNAIAQNFVENPTYFPDSLIENEANLAKIVKQIPLGRLAKGEESANLALYLASDKSDFMCGQVIPFAGGWI